jgi:hypothetical protein
LTFSVFPWVTGRRFLDSTNGNRGFESVLLQRRVFWELDFFNAHQAPAAAVVGARFLGDDLVVFVISFCCDI